MNVCENLNVLFGKQVTCLHLGFSVSCSPFFFVFLRSDTDYRRQTYCTYLKAECKRNADSKWNTISLTRVGKCSSTASHISRQLKDKFIQKRKLSHHLRTPMPVESQSRSHTYYAYTSLFLFLIFFLEYCLLFVIIVYC